MPQPEADHDDDHAYVTRRVFPVTPHYAGEKPRGSNAAAYVHLKPVKSGPFKSRSASWSRTHRARFVY